MNAGKTGDNGQKRRSYGPLLLGLLILASIVAIAVPLYFGRMMMDGTSPQTVQQFALSSPGSTMNVVLQVASLPVPTLFEGMLLQKNDDGSYSRSGQYIGVQWNPAQPVTMGRNSDIAVGAILQVHGTLASQKVLTASQIVVLTSYIQIK